MAKVLSSISGNLISAASAGYAPTNSGDVSAIASAYQVVSATATQLYAGTAYVTSLNSAPLSASRAGNAANAAMATSAYYDGTGRLISALPDSATVSAIASSYAESAASGKLDSGTYISATGLNQRISNAAGTQQVSFASGTNGTAAGVWLTGQFGTAYYKDNELKLNRGSGQIAFNIGGQGPKITASAGGYYASVIYTMNANESAVYSNLGVTMGNNSGVSSVYKNTGISGDNSSHTGFWAYGSAEYNKLTGVHDTVSSNSATWASASAISSYALSADVSSTIDTVSAQSANWGGSALALSAGPGIRFDKVDNTLVASVDETVLWEGSARLTSYSSTLSDSLHNYKYVDIYVQPNSADLNKRGNQVRRFEVVNAGETAELYFPRTESMENYHEVSEVFYVWNYNNGSDFTLKNGARWSGDTYASSITAYRGMVTKIVGVCKI